MEEINKIQSALLDWYRNEARNLPWREDKDPYKVWISEIMLQQTRVDPVIPFFNRFIEEIPNIKALAEIDDEKLMKLWEGLGYYNRARNLKKAAALIMEKHHGSIPGDQASLLALPGIGKYTSGAILSIAFGKQAAAADGNVLRIMARINAVQEDITDPKVKRQLEEFAQTMVPADEPGDFNQALMDLGASLCMPKGAPKCRTCPIRSYCDSFSMGLVSIIPLKAVKKTRLIEKKTILLIRQGEEYALRKRDQSALLANLWELPNYEGELSEDQCRRKMEDLGFEIVCIKSLKPAKHLFTHLEWHMTGYSIHAGNRPDLSELIWATKEEIRGYYSIPKAFQAYLEQADL